MHPLCQKVVYNPIYYLTHCDNAQNGHTALNIRRACSINIYPAICVILYVAEENGNFSSFFPNKGRKLCFVINVLNN